MLLKSPPNNSLLLSKLHLPSFQEIKLFLESKDRPTCDFYPACGTQDKIASIPHTSEGF